LVEVRAMIATIALSDVHNVLPRLLVAVIAPIDMKARRVEMGKAGRKGQTLGSVSGYEAVEFCYSRGIEGIQGPTEGVIVELVGGNARGNQSRGGLVVKELGHQVEGLIDKAQSIEHHGLNRFPCGQVSHFRVLLGGLIDDIANAEFVEHASDKAEMV
jgi:hypothetical protein